MGMSEPSAKRFRTNETGARVEISGLRSESGQKLNGLTATVVEQDLATGRVTVELDSGVGRKALKEENLTAAPLPRPGARVEIQGLKNDTAKSMNGKAGVVRQKRDLATMRYQVEVTYGGGVPRVAAFKAENLKILPEPIWGLQLQADVKSVKGARPKQEDRHVLLLNLHEAGAALFKESSFDHLPRPSALFSVLDGHLGSACSEYVASHLHEKVLAQLVKTDPELRTECIKNMLSECFREIDERFLANHKGPDGSTCVLALLLGCDLFVAAVGDSVAVLCDANGVVAKSFDFQDQRPGSEQERKRILDAGGEVVQIAGQWRASHANFNERTLAYVAEKKAGRSAKMPLAMAVARAFGDQDFKYSLDLTQRQDVICCVPEVEHVALKPGQHRALVLMSDGVTDVMTLEEVCKKVRSFDGQPKAGCQAVCSESIKRKSNDNVTAIVVFFRWSAAG